MNHNQKVAAAVGTSALAAMFIIWLYRRRKSDDNDITPETDFADLTATDTSSASANASVAEVAVPYYAVGSIIGRGGEVIKQLKKETGTRLDFHDKRSGRDDNDKSDRILTIKGSRDKVELAEMKIKHLIATHPVLTSEDIFIPQNCCGRIIGKGGQTIRDMCNQSEAKIIVDRQEMSGSQSKKRITITGTDESIEIAKTLIYEKLQDEYQFRGKKGLNKRSTDASKIINIKDFPAIRFPDGDETFIKVFVSAFDTPENIWVQLITPEASRLDSLTGDLTSYYSSSSDNEDMLNDLSVGMVCSAPFELDQEWYRACITDIDDDDNTVGLYYMDFGDTGRVDKSTLRQLRSEFMNLPAQAIQCRLHSVKPVGDTWSDESIASFESITHCAQWVPLLIRVVGYETIDGNEIPLVDVIDTNGTEDIDIREQLIKNGHALTKEQATQTAITKPQKEIPHQIEKKESLRTESTLKEKKVGVEESEINVTKEKELKSYEEKAENSEVIPQKEENKDTSIVQDIKMENVNESEINIIEEEELKAYEDEPDVLIENETLIESQIPQVNSPDVTITTDKNVYEDGETSTDADTLEQYNLLHAGSDHLLNGDNNTDNDDNQSEADSFFSARSDARTPTNMEDFDTDTMSYTSARSDARTPTNLNTVDPQSNSNINNVDQEKKLRRKSSNDGFDIIETPVASDADEEENGTPTVTDDKDYQYEIRVLDETEKKVESTVLVDTKLTLNMSIVSD